MLQGMKGDLSFKINLTKSFKLVFLCLGLSSDEKCFFIELPQWHRNLIWLLKLLFYFFKVTFI